MMFVGDVPQPSGRGTSIVRNVAVTSLLVVGAFVAVSFHFAATPSAVPSELAVATCSLQPGAGKAAKNTLYGHNQINGPIYPVKFNDAALESIAKALWSGMLRYPGGTVGNYWYWPNATYIDPCEGYGPFKPATSTQSNAAGIAKTLGPYDYNYCNKQKSVGEFPKQTFTPANFATGVGAASPVQSLEGQMWMINCLTATAAEIRAQFDWLKTQATSHSFPVTHLEFGNEFFMGEYAPWFPSDSTHNPAEIYIQNIRHAIYEARAMFPGVKIAVPFAYHFCLKPEQLTNLKGSYMNNPRYHAWNTGLAKHSALFDAVTIHEYTACSKSVDTAAYATLADQKMALAAWGDAAIDQQRLWIKSFLGTPKEIWQTEWNYASWVGLPLQSETDWSAESVTNSAITGIYSASFGLKFVESYIQPDKTLPYHTAANHHLFNQQMGQAWGTNSGFGDLTADGDGSKINGAGQIFSHLSYVALQLCDTMHAVRIDGGCGTLSISLLEGQAGIASGLNCLYATAHTHSCRKGALPIYQVINRCNQAVPTHIDVSSALSGQVRVSSYGSEQDGPWTPLYSLNGQYEHPWTNGPLKPKVTTTAITPTAQYGQRIVLPPISFSVIEFAQPGYSASHLAKGCPAIEF